LPQPSRPAENTEEEPFEILDSREEKKLTGEKMGTDPIYLMNRGEWWCMRGCALAGLVSGAALQ
jgi:hypothetical protein